MDGGKGWDKVRSFDCVSVQATNLRQMAIQFLSEL